MPLVPQLLFSPSYFWSLLEVPTCLRIGSSHTGTLYWYNCARGRGEKTQTPQTLSLLLIADCVLSPWFGYLRNEIKRHTHAHIGLHGIRLAGWLAGWGRIVTILHGLEPAEPAAPLDLLDLHQPKGQIPVLGLRIILPSLSPLPILPRVLDFKRF